MRFRLLSALRTRSFGSAARHVAAESASTQRASTSQSSANRKERLRRMRLALQTAVSADDPLCVPRAFAAVAGGAESDSFLSSLMVVCRTAVVRTRSISLTSALALSRTHSTSLSACRRQTESSVARLDQQRCPFMRPPMNPPARPLLLLLTDRLAALVALMRLTSRLPLLLPFLLLPLHRRLPRLPLLCLL